MFWYFRHLFIKGIRLDYWDFLWSMWDSSWNCISLWRVCRWSLSVIFPDGDQWQTANWHGEPMLVAGDQRTKTDVCKSNNISAFVHCPRKLRGTITVRRSRLFREKRPDGKKSTWLEAGTQISTRRRASGSTKAVCSTSGTTGSEKLSSEFVCHCEHAISTSAHLLFHGRWKVFPQQVSPI